MSKRTLRLDVRPRLKRLGRSAAWLSRESGVSLSTLRRHWRGKRKGFEYDTLDKLCSSLDCQPSDILIEVKR
ncbi:MAG TPA: helix-turn-helix domain-containing protein [Pyrinomonadaceae bacterium]